MANEYDVIFKENLEEFFIPLLEQITQTDFSKTEDISLEMQLTLERKADFLKKVLAKKPYILHLEIQSQNDARMLSRMMIYYALLRKKYKYRLPVRQYVLYVGKEKMNMQAQDSEASNHFQYTLIDIREFSAQLFLQSDVPEVVILSILADLQQQPAEEMITNILARLKELLPEDGRLYQYIRQLEQIAKLRNISLEDLNLKPSDTMPVIIDYTTDRLYLQGQKTKEKEDIKKFLLSGKLNAQEIATIMDVPLDMVKEIEASLKK